MGHQLTLSTSSSKRVFQIDVGCDLNWQVAARYGNSRSHFGLNDSNPPLAVWGALSPDRERFNSPNQGSDEPSMGQGQKDAGR